MTLMPCTHTKTRVLQPGEEADHMKPPYYCQGHEDCETRPLLLCLECGACVCDDHAGRLCNAVTKNGHRCVVRCGLPRPFQHRHHYYEP